MTIHPRNRSDMTAVREDRHALMDKTPSSAATEEHLKVVITGQGREEAGRLPLLYASAMRRAGGAPEVYMPFDHLRPEDTIPDDLPVHMGVDPDDPRALEGAAGLILPGGGDIDPAHYGADRHPRTRHVSPLRDRYELTLLGAAMERDMPIFCICRGFQLLNVYLEGTLDQHLPDHPETLEHDRDMPRADPAHSIHLKEGSMLAEIFGVLELPVNSHHHQGLGIVADGLEEVAWAGDGVLEAAVAAQAGWVLGVQWHPEVMAPVDHRQMQLFEAFATACRSYARAAAAA